MTGTIVKWALAVLAGTLAVLYCGDYVVIKIRAAKSPSALFPASSPGGVPT